MPLLDPRTYQSIVNMLLKFAALLAAVGTAVAQRPMNASICDYCMYPASPAISTSSLTRTYPDTTALLKDNSAENQYKLLTLLVNTAVIGN